MQGAPVGVVQRLRSPRHMVQRIFAGNSLAEINHGHSGPAGFIGDKQERGAYTFMAVEKFRFKERIPNQAHPMN